MTVVYPGPEGSHSDAAAAAMFPDSERMPASSFRAVAEAVASASASHGVLPIESSLAGAVAETHDLLDECPLSIVAEAVLPITHALVARQHLSLADIAVVRSHPSALDQCRQLLHRLPHAQIVASATTADAARETAESGEPRAAAIAGAGAALRYGLVVLADDVGDAPAFTRFVAVAPFTSLDVPSERARTAFTFIADHRPGSLHAAIAPFAHADLDLLRLVSRPLPATPWSYRFDAVVAGHPLDPTVRHAFAELQRSTRSYRIVGVYEGVDEHFGPTDP
ncbi:MAG TPA: prephenate dehydratase domain-containing protein [Gaiellaceae bacterium]|nr:prephenate dehydratase domain-containing protein [Gaiellaceae bacterium]